VAATASAAEIYQQKCQGCHGAGGRGGRAPALTGLAGTEDDVRRIVQNGEGRMPGFGGSLNAAQITAVAKYALGLRK
jgi:mono/diheme cytochrome c family protein